MLLVFPWLAAPFSLLGLVGIGKASLDPFYSSWDGLDDPQRTELPGSAVDAEETMPGFLTGQSA